MKMWLKHPGWTEQDTGKVESSLFLDQIWRLKVLLKVDVKLWDANEKLLIYANANDNRWEKWTAS